MKTGKRIVKIDLSKQQFLYHCKKWDTVGEVVWKAVRVALLGPAPVQKTKQNCFSDLSYNQK